MEIIADLFDFVWWKCPDGFDLEIPSGANDGKDHELVAPGGGSHGAVKVPKHMLPQGSVTAKSKRIEKYKPFQTKAQIHQDLRSMTPDGDGALAFTRKWGLLTGDLNELSYTMPVKTFLDFRNSVIRVLECLENGDGKITKLFNKEFPIEHHDFRLLLREDKSLKPAIHIVPAGLRDFVIYGLAAEIAGSVSPRKCAAPGCENVLLIGPSSGRGIATKRRKTCSERCRKAFNRAINKAKKEQANDQ